MLLREQNAIIRSHQMEWPVQTVPIANALGLQVFRARGWPNNISGMIVRDDEGLSESGFVIYVNAEHPEVRRRFTIAHEIGHFVLHQSLIGDGVVEDALLRAEGLSNKVEAQANKMAADILMPWHLIELAEKEGIVTIEELARAFKVSTDAMSIRVLGLSYGRARELNHDRVEAAE